MLNRIGLELDRERPRRCGRVMNFAHVTSQSDRCTVQRCVLAIELRRSAELF
jgi:hypothetical protein